MHIFDDFATQVHGYSCHPNHERSFCHGNLSDEANCVLFA